MRWALVTLNENAIEVARQVKSVRQVDIYTMPRNLSDGLEPIEGKLVDFSKVLFETYDVIIYCMAMGIIVRSIAPYIGHKSYDPAVLCLSVDGEHIIPVLSGHLGGANEVAINVADAIGAKPVITTASDLMNVTAVDMIAKANDLIIRSFEKAKDVTALIVDGKKVGLINDYGDLKGDIQGVVTEWCGPFEHKEAKDVNGEIGKLDGYIYIGHRSPNNLTKPIAHLEPKNLILGIGARRGTSLEAIEALLQKSLDNNGIHREAIIGIASIDIKADEEGIIGLSEKLNIPFETYKADVLKSVEDLFECSEFVRKITGVGSVCMTSGYIASGKGQCLVEKVAKNGITLCLFEKS